MSVSPTKITVLSPVASQRLSFSDYIHQTRVDRATELLRDTNMTVEQIAHAVGYQSALTLTQAYKRYYNISPGIARKKQQSFS